MQSYDGTQIIHKKSRLILDQPAFQYLICFCRLFSDYLNLDFMLHLFVKIKRYGVGT